MKKKVLMIMPSMFIGGAERSLLGLLDSFDYEKYEVSLFLYRHEGDFLPLIPDKVNVLDEMEKYRTFDTPIKTLINGSKIRFAFRRIMSKLALKAHCIVSGEQQGVWMAMQYTSKFLQSLLPEIPGQYDLAVSFLGVPDVLVNKVNAKVKAAWNHTDYKTLNPDKRYDRLIYKKIDSIVNVSESCKQAFDAVYPDLSEKSIVIENILSKPFVEKRADEFEAEEMKKENGETVLLSVGRFSNAKNFDNVPDICRRVTEKGLNIKWYLVGYGGDEELIRQKIAEAGMENRVVILGKKVNPYPYIKACDVYVQPSRFEGKAVTVREAQILNKPVIITDFATSKSQLENGFDGMIVPLENEKCADGIAEIIRDKNLLQKLSDNTKKRDYTNSSQIEKIYAMVKNDED
ncbi:MAG: glycosyltransferase [Acutalibacteraceae bacterium]